MILDRHEIASVHNAPRLPEGSFVGFGWETWRASKGTLQPCVWRQIELGRGDCTIWT